MLKWHENNSVGQSREENEIHELFPPIWTSRFLLPLNRLVIACRSFYDTYDKLIRNQLSHHNEIFKSCVEIDVKYYIRTRIPKRSVSGVLHFYNVDFHEGNMSSPSETQYEFQISFCYEVSVVRPMS